MRCPNCQTSNPDEAKFCMNCGNSFAAAIHVTDGEINNAQAKNQSIDKFIPRELMTKFEAARSQDAMVGERRVITMLFAMLKVRQPPHIHIHVATHIGIQWTDEPHFKVRLQSG